LNAENNTEKLNEGHVGSFTFWLTAWFSRFLRSSAH